MSGTDYILGLFAIVTGLAIADMIVSLHGLLMNRRNVTWDWLPIVAAAFVLLQIIATWRAFYVGFQEALKGPPIWVFVMLLTQNIGLYLAARAALPDHVKVGEPINLGAHYDFVGRYLWSAILVSYAMVIILMGLEPFVLGTRQFPTIFVQLLIVFPVVLSLVIWPSRRLHRIIIPLLFLWICIRLLPARLLIA